MTTGINKKANKFWLTKLLVLFEVVVLIWIIHIFIKEIIL